MAFCWLWPSSSPRIIYPNGQTAVLTYDREGENSLTNSGTGLISDIRYNGRGKQQQIGVRKGFLGVESVVLSCRLVILLGRNGRETSAN
jgi:hypothetical protein